MCSIGSAGLYGRAGGVHLLVPVIPLWKLSGYRWPRREDGRKNVHDKKVQIGVDTNDVLKVSFCYVGTVANVPVNGAIKVCSAFNADFYITPKAGSNVPTSINFTPAWIVPEDKHPNLKFKENTVTFTYTHKALLGTIKEFKIPVKLYSLVTDEAIYDQPGSDFVVLKRPATDIILKGVGVKRQVVQKTFDMEWRQYKFLMV